MTETSPIFTSGKSPIIVKYDSAKVKTEAELKDEKEKIEAEKQRMLEHQKGVQNKKIVFYSVILLIPVLLFISLYFSYVKLQKGQNQQSYIWGSLAIIIIFAYASNAKIYGKGLGSLTYDVIRRTFPSIEVWLLTNGYVKN